jgi:hypothetical protein
MPKRHQFAGSLHKSLVAPLLPVLVCGLPQAPLFGIITHYDYEKYYTAAVLQHACVRGFVRADLRVLGQQGRHGQNDHGGHFPSV